MVRFIAVILTFTMGFHAFAAINFHASKIEMLAKKARTVTDLEVLHASLNELYQLSTSSMLDAETKKLAAFTLLTLANESTARVLEHNTSRTAEDLLTIHMAELGLAEKSNIMNIDAMISLGSDRIKLAGTIFLREHFLGRNPDEGYFPARPPNDEQSEVEWQQGMCLWAVDKMPTILAKISYNYSNNKDSELGQISQTTYTKITRMLVEAANDRRIELSATIPAKKLRIIRQNLATHWMDKLVELRKAWKEVKFPSPGVGPETRPDNPNLPDPRGEIPVPMGECEAEVIKFPNGPTIH